MTKPQRRALERLYVASLPPEFGGAALGIVQSKSKAFNALAEQGLCGWVEQVIGGRFPVSVEGWVITPAGHLAYCMSCDPTPDSETKETP
jgi:hypothetical protein